MRLVHILRKKALTSVAVLTLLFSSIPIAAMGEEKTDRSGSRGSLALVNTAKSGGHELALRAGQALRDHVGGWARQPGINAFLAGRPNPGPLPVGDTGKDLVRLVERVRSSPRTSSKDLSALGKLLGVDYLLLLRAQSSGFRAHLFSVRRQAFAPQGFTGTKEQIDRLTTYVLDQTGEKQPAPKRLLGKRWWIWAIAAGLAAVTIGLAVSASDDTKGDLRIQVKR